MSIHDIAKKHGLSSISEGTKTSSKSGSSSIHDIAKKHGLTYEIDQDYINSFITDANNFLSTVEDDYKNVGWWNAGSTYESYRSTWSDLEKRADQVAGWLGQNKDKLDQETYNSLYSAVNNIKSGASTTLESFKNASDFYGRFDTEEAYKTYMADRYPVDTSLPDFSTLGSEGWQKYLEGVEKDRQAAIQAEEEKAWWEKLLEYNAQAHDISADPYGYNHMVKTIREDTTYRTPNDDWEEEQKLVFGYLWNDGDTAKAYRYAEVTNADINQKKEEEALKKIAENAASGFWAGLGNTLGAIVTAPTGMADFIYDLAHVSAGREIAPDGFVSPFEYSQAVTSGISTHLNDKFGTIDDDVWLFGGKGWGDVYGLGTSIAQSLASAYTLGPTGTLISYFGQGAASGIDDALSRGATDIQAVLYGIALGAFEGAAESIGIDHLFKLGSATRKEFFKNLLKQAGAEGMEEGLTALLSNIADNVIMQDKSNFNIRVAQYKNSGLSDSKAKFKAWMDSVEETAFDTIGGAISGGVSGSVHTTGHNIVANINAKKKYGSGAGIVNEALSVSSEGSELRNLAEKYKGKLDGGKKLSGSQIVRLDEAIRSNDADLIKKAVLRRLGDLGETTDVTPIAETLVKYALGEKLSSKDNAILNNSDKGNIVLAEINKKNIESGLLGNKWAENIGTRRVSPESYNKNLYNLAKEFSAMVEGKVKESMAKTLAENAKAVETKFETSEGGKTLYNDEKVSIKKIASIKNGEIKLTLDNGKTVSAKDVSFGSTNEALAYSVISDMGVGIDTANEIINAFKNVDEASLQKYAVGINLAYKYGTINYEEGLSNISIPDDVKRIVFNRGRIDAKESGRTWSNTSRKENDITTAKTSEDGIIYEGFELNEDSLTDIQKASLAGVRTIAKMSSLEIHIYEGIIENGKRYAIVNGKKRKAPNGYFRDGNRIFIDINAGSRSMGTMLYTLSHEVVHYIAENNFEGFKELADFLFENYGKKGVPVDYLINREIAKIKESYKRDKKKLPSPNDLYMKAYEEVVAEAMSKMLADPKSYEKLAKLKSENYSLWKTIGEAIKMLLDKLKPLLGVYSGLTPDAMAAHYVDDFSTEVYNKLQDLYVKAFVKADENVKATEASKEKGFVGKYTNRQYTAVQAELLASLPTEALQNAVDSNGALSFNHIGIGGNKTAQQEWVNAGLTYSEDGNIFVDENAVLDERDRRRGEKGQSNQASIGSRNLEDFADAKNSDGETLFQYKAMEADEDTYRDMLKKWGKMTDVQIDNLFITIDKAMDIIKDNLEALDYAWEADIDDRAFSPVKPNSDKLYQVSLDFSTLCRKRILQQMVQAQLQEALNKPLTREEGIAIRDALMALQEEGRQIEVACALCYVESARMKSPEQIKRFIGNKEKVIRDFFAGKSGGNIKETVKKAEADARERLGVGSDTPLKSLPGKVAQEIRDAKKAAKESYKPTAEEQKLIDVAKSMTVSDFTSPEGLENLAKNYPRLFDAYTSYIRNATKSKGIESDTWWRAGDSMKIGDVLIANMNKENGLRSQSWSDFQVIHILDYIASTIELATRNTKEQAYSKVPDYVELMGLTGVMINMSLIPTAKFNGSLDYDSVEGMDYKRALKLRDKYHATAGTICIGVDNVQIKLLLADTTIDYVIPYHRSGMSKALRKLMHIPTWSDYELYQSEAKLSRADAEKQAKKHGVKLLNTSDPNYQKATSFSEWFDIKEAQQIAKMENANPSDKAKQKKYGVMYGGYMAMQNAANNYLKLCAERGLSPKFSHENADFTAEENYWKLLIDRKMVDNVTGEVIEQKNIKPVFDEAEILRILNDELARYPSVKADQDYAIRKVTEAYLSGELKGGMSAEAIAKIMKTPVDNVTTTNVVASAEHNPRLTDSDLDEYMKVGKKLHTRNRKRKLLESGKKPILTTSTEIISFMSDVIRGEAVNEVRAFAKVGARLAGEILRIDSTLDVFGDYLELHADNLREAYKVHSSPKEVGDIPLSDTDFERIPEYLDDFDGVLLTNTHNGKKEVHLYKETDEGYIRMLAVSSNERGSLMVTKLIGVSKEKFERKYAKKIERDTAKPRGQTDFSEASIPPTEARHTANALSKRIIPHSDNSVKGESEDSDTVFSEVDYAPTFYSHMGKVIDGIKIEKMGAGGVVSYLKGKGVKNEEIKWSGIEAFLEGKKSVSKAELQEFVAGSQLQIEEKEIAGDGKADHFDDFYSRMNSVLPGFSVEEIEEMCFDYDGDFSAEKFESELKVYVEDGTISEYDFADATEYAEEMAEKLNSEGTRWSQYKLDGGTSYRELVFTLPNSTYSNQAMRVHWGEDAEGILAHARIQDFEVNGKKMLFIEEIQSDWHNAGNKKGYVDISKKVTLSNTTVKHEGGRYRLYRGDTELYANVSDETLKNRFPNGITKEQIHQGLVDKHNDDLSKAGGVDDAPFRNNYHEYVLKRLLRMAAEEGYDSIGWTPSWIQSERWSEDYAEAYRIEYDQDMPSFLKKYGKRWGATVGKAEIEQAEHTVNGEHYDAEKIEVWSMDITDSMKDSVLTEGQVLYSEDFSESGARAVEEFGYTPYFYDAGYLLPNGRMLNFSGENGKHFGARRENHRAIGRIYDDVSGSDAMVRFMNEGNIRIMAESAGIDLGTNVAPTVSQYNTIARFISECKKKGRFFVDFTDASGKYIGSLEYDGRLSTEEIVYDIKDYYKTGKVRDQSKDYLYSEQDPDSVSNRSLLANALESIAQNDIERNKLAQYKEKIALIEAEQAKLSEINAKLHELRFTKGARDTEAINKLQFEANQITSRINTYDKQLLSLESTAALKGVLEREKAMLKKRIEQKGKEALAKQKEREAQKTRLMMTQYQESRKKAIDSHHRTEMRHKIKNVVSELDKLLRKGSKERNVKLGLQGAVASALEAVNMDTIAAEERIAKLKQELMRAKTPEKIQEISRKIDNIQEMGDRMASKLEMLRKAYADIRTSEENIPEYYKAEASLIADKVDSVMKEVGNTPLRNMNMSQLEAVYNLYTMVLTTVRNANKLFKQGKTEDLQQNVNSIMTEIDSVKKLKEERWDGGEFWRKQSWNEMIPAYAFERIGSKTFTSFFWEAIKGQNTFAVDISEANDFASEAREKYGYKKWDFDKIHEFRLADGQIFRVSLKHMMSIYAYSKRDQALAHMQKGGFFFNDKDTFRKVKGVFKLIKSNEVGYKVSLDMLNAIKGEMTSEQIQYVDAMQEYLTKMGEKGNEVSRVLWGIDIFKEKVYFPLKSSRDFIFQANQTAQEASLKNDGMTKETVPNASNPIVLEAFDDVWASHVNRMSQYHAFVLPIENLNKIHNYGTWNGTAAMSVSTMLTARFGNSVNEYLTQLIKDLNGVSSGQGASNPFMKFFSKFKKTAVAASLSVVVQQPTAILRALSVMDAKYFVGKPNLSKLSTKWEEMKKYAPITIIKEIGGFDAGAGRQATEWLNSDIRRGMDKVMGTIDDVSMMGAALGDQVGWTTIWEAVKRETKATTNLKEGSEEFLKKAGERFTEVIVLTQVYDSTLSRSGYMRSQHDTVKMATSFMGEPTVSFNMLFNAVSQVVKGKMSKKEAARTIGAVYASVVMAAVASSLIYALRDDDDDESYLEKLAEALGEKVVNEINPLNMLPFVRDVMSILDGWDVSRTDMDVFADLYSAITTLDSDNKSAWRKVEDLSGAFASLFGVPLKNTLRTGREIYNLFENIFDGVSPSGVGDAFLRGVTGKDKSKSEALYDALVSGDETRIENLRKGYKDDKAYESAVRTALKENDPRIKEAAEARYNGDTATYMSIAKEIIAEGVFSQDDVVAAINAQINAIKKNNGDVTSSSTSEDKETSIVKVADYYASIVGRDQASAYAVKEDLIRTEMANGKDREEAEASFNSKLTSYLGTLYEDGKITSTNAKSMLINHAGKTAEEADSKVQYWEFKKKYPNYDLTESAVSKYYEYAQPSGISVSVYYDYTNKRAKCKGTDSDGDGKTDSGSVKSEVMKVINSLPITSKQKDALYYLNGWSASTLWEAPWH